MAAAIRRRGGLAATFELYADGFSRQQLHAAVANRQVIRVRQGWYTTVDTHPLLIQGARVGGQVTCLSGLSLHGVWTYPTSDLHVSVPPQACRLRVKDDMRERLADLRRPLVRTHWTASIAATAAAVTTAVATTSAVASTVASRSRLMLDPIACLEDAIGCQNPESLTAAGDSLLHTMPHLAAAWAQLAARSIRAHRGYLQHIDGVCESGTESLVWFRLRPFRLSIVRQVRIDGVGRVDFLVGQRLVVEADGAEYHTDPIQFERDRHRDAVLSRLGYRVLRFSYRQIMFNWPEVETAILSAVFRGDHH